MNKTLTKLHRGDVAKALGGFVLRKIQKEAPAAELTIIHFYSYKKAPYLRFVKEDDSPTIITWWDGKREIITAAGNVTSIGTNIEDGGDGFDGWVTIENHGPWKVGHGATWLGLLCGYTTTQKGDVYLNSAILDHHCTEILNYGLHTAMHNDIPLRRIFIPNTVSKVGTYALWSHKAGSVYDLVNCEVEFEAVTPPVFAGSMFRDGEPPLRIEVPARSCAAYMTATNMTAWASFVVGKETFAINTVLPNYSTAEYPVCTWYSNPECTQVIPDGVAHADGALYFCKLTAA